METHFRPSGNSREPRPTRVDRQAFLFTAAQCPNLRDGFELDRPGSSHGDNHHKVKNHFSSPPCVASGNRPKQQTKRANAAKNDELVKHMSNLPSYLERVKRQEKAFNVGVLDWSVLEKWHSSKQVPYRSDGSSSHINSSSLLSTEESATQSRTGHSSLVAHHRHQHPAYKFQLKGLSSDSCSSNGKSSGNVNQNQLGMPDETTTSFSENGNMDSHDISSSSKGQHRGDSKKEPRPRRSQSMSLNHKSSEKGIYARHHDDCSIASISKSVKVAAGHRYAEENERSCNEIPGKVRYAELSLDSPLTCPLPCDVNDKTIKVLRPCGSQEAPENDGASAEGSSSKENFPVIMPALPTVTDLFQGSRISKQKVDAAKARHLSPTGRFSFRLGTSSKKSSSAEDAEVMQACSAHKVPKPCTKREVNSTSLEKSGHDKSVAASKGRSSPLKRLLDPLLKPRDVNNNLSSKPLNRDLKPVGRVSKTLERPSTAPGTRVGLNLRSQKSTTIDKSYFNGKNKEPEVVQALLQVVVQNGCPLFTFAVDAVKDILCAALSKLSTKKEFEERYLYTIFSIQELKNKSWINLRGKGSGLEYSPNVVAQMEVSETQLLNTAEYESTGNNLFREFVLSTVDLKPGEKSDLQYQLNDELAAVVVAISGDTDDQLRPGKFIGTNVILPSSIHTLPSKGKPSSLIERWRSGGQCDCGGWDSGCKLRILNDSKCQSSSPVRYKLFDQGETKPVFNLAPYKDKEGVLSASFSSSISPLQAFSISLAILDARKHSEPPPAVANIQDAKTSDETSHVVPPGSYVSVPPHSPVGRV